MTNEQLYFAIGIPIMFNAIGFTFMVLWVKTEISSLRTEMRAEISSIRTEMRAGFDVLNERLKRVEEVMDARLKHLEEK